VRPWALLALALVVGGPAIAAPPKAPTLSLALTPKNSPLLTEFEKQVRESRRFVVVAPVAFNTLDMPLESAIPKLQKLAKSDWVLAGSISTLKDKSIQLTARLYDLRYADSSKELRFMGAGADVTKLARSLLTYMKSKAPLNGEITGLKDDRVLLDIGAEDGVATGSVFTITRKPGDEAFWLGTVRVIEREAWFSTAEVVSRRRGSHWVPGDLAVEDVAAGIIR
jgi:hypothetical protein